MTSHENQEYLLLSKTTANFDYVCVIFSLVDITPCNQSGLRSIFFTCFRHDGNVDIKTSTFKTHVAYTKAENQHSILRSFCLQKDQFFKTFNVDFYPWSSLENR